MVTSVTSLAARTVSSAACLRPKVYLTDLFADDACSQPVESTQAEVLAVEVPDVCPAQVRVYARGDRHEGPVFAISDGGGCERAFESSAERQRKDAALRVSD